MNEAHLNPFWQSCSSFAFGVGEEESVSCLEKSELLGDEPRKSRTQESAYNQRKIIKGLIQIDFKWGAVEK